MEEIKGKQHPNQCHYKAQSILLLLVIHAWVVILSLRSLSILAVAFLQVKIEDEGSKY